MPRSPKRDATLPNRHPRDRALVVLLVLLTLAPFLLYAWVAVESAREMRLRHALERNRATAELGARLVDAQCSSALAVLRSLASRDALVAALEHPPGSRSGRESRRVAEAGEGVERHLQDAVELVPELALVAAYRRDGTLMASYPSTPRPGGRAAQEEWYRQVVATGRPCVSSLTRLGSAQGAPVVNLAVPVGPEARPIGYLMAPYRVEVIQAWLQPLRTGGGSVLVLVDGRGQLVAASVDPTEKAPARPELELLRPYLARRYGVEEVSAPEGRDRLLIGHARAQVPGWMAFAVQPTETATASVNFLVWRLMVLIVPALGIMLAAGWTIDGMYRRQTELARRNAELSRDLSIQNERLRAADAARSKLLEDVSHELRTPLTRMKAVTSGLAEPDMVWDREVLRGYLTFVDEEIDWLAASVRNLLAMSRIEAGALPTRKERCDLVEIVESALERMEPLMRGWQIDTRFPPEPLLVEADSAQLETVIVNLLENAVKYSPPESTLSLAAEARREAGAEIVLFTLSDQGLGVPPGKEERIFERFYRAHPPSPSGGTGLGLAICKAIVEAHGGAIGVRPAAGGGAEFWLSLPRAPGSEPEHEEGGEQ